MLNLTENIFWDVNRNYTGDVFTLEDFYEEEPVVSDVSEPLKDGTIDQNWKSKCMSNPMVCGNAKFVRKLVNW